MDLFAALALSTEPPIKSVIYSKPFKKDKSLMTNTIKRQILGISVFNFLIMVLVMFFGEWVGGLEHYERKVTTLVHMPDGFDARKTSNSMTIDDKIYV